MTHPRYNGRAAKVRAHLAKHPDGCSLSQLIAAIEPDCKHNVMAGTVSTLVRQGKARAEPSAPGVRGNRYFATDATLVDRRAAANAATGAKRRGKAQPGTRRTTAEVAPVRRTSDRTPARARAKQGDAIRQVISGLAKAPPRTRVAAAVTGDGRETVDQFLRSGGQIERLPPGASATPLSITLHDINEASMRRRKARLAGEY